jgi:hypothetical protein
LPQQGLYTHLTAASLALLLPSSHPRSMPVQVVGPPPPGLQGLKVEGEEGKVQAPQSFLAKYVSALFFYCTPVDNCNCFVVPLADNITLVSPAHSQWYLILPAMIIMLLNGGPPPEQGQGGAAAPAAAPR